MLSQSRINQIEALVREVLTTLDPNLEKIKAPISLWQIMKNFQITLKTGQFEDSTVSGAYNKKDKTIFVEKEEPYTRKMFTIAHELGHYFLHEDKKAEFFYRAQVLKLDDEKSAEEQEANWFAASLLMPEVLIRYFWELTNDPDQLSIIFGVSPTAVFYRLKNLHLMA